jgi:hypothetical protein
MSAKSPRTDRLKASFGRLAVEIQDSKIHLQIYEQLELEKRKHQGRLSDSLDFWERTTTAHLIAALVSLCRIYDKSPRAFHLLRLIRQIQSLCPNALSSPIARKARSTDLRFIENDRRVRSLRKWRNVAICHCDQKPMLSDREEMSEFLKDFCLELDDVRTLIHKAAEIHGQWTERCKINYPIQELRNIECQVDSVIESCLKCAPVGK